MAIELPVRADRAADQVGAAIEDTLSRAGETIGSIAERGASAIDDYDIEEAVRDTMRRMQDERSSLLLASLATLAIIALIASVLVVSRRRASTKKPARRNRRGRGRPANAGAKS